ncbi:MAG: iron-containing alcohol dehydrogenase [Mariprofundaceae bacterium]|nr:iron-containing alcohol dehydrogenase [Mariprofundaceae bacterium]
MLTAFDFAASPHIHFGSGKRDTLKDLASSFSHEDGGRILLVTGGDSFDASPLCRKLETELAAEFQLRRLRVEEEPSPSLIDAAVAEHRHFDPACVIAIGGGSAVDAGKAIAGLLLLGHSVMEYLEGVGKGLAYRGPSAPFIAVPTTAGTGGETSKNAVLSVIGEGGFKKSFRHEMLVARHIILDPELTLTCPAELTAACGMDAFTQLLESYVSSQANAMTDALALSAMRIVRDCLPRVVADADDLTARSGMLYASSMSGLTLANAGLGSVHGLASPLGAFFPIPHGVVCGTLLHVATDVNIRAMQDREPENPSLARYAQAGRLLSKDDGLSQSAALDALLALLEEWTTLFRMPLLGVYGVGHEDVPRIVASSRGNSMQTNPIVLSDEEIAGLISHRL